MLYRNNEIFIFEGSTSRGFGVLGSKWSFLAFTPCCWPARAWCERNEGCQHTLIPAQDSAIIAVSMTKSPCLTLQKLPRLTICWHLAWPSTFKLNDIIYIHCADSEIRTHDGALQDDVSEQNRSCPMKILLRIHWNLIENILDLNKFLSRSHLDVC